MATSTPHQRAAVLERTTTSGFGRLTWSTREFKCGRKPFIGGFFFCMWFVETGGVRLRSDKQTVRRRGVNNPQPRRPGKDVVRCGVALRVIRVYIYGSQCCIEYVKWLQSWLSYSIQFWELTFVTRRGGGLGSSTIFKKFNETYAPS